MAGMEKCLRDSQFVLQLGAAKWRTPPAMTAIGAFEWSCTMPLHTLSSAAHPTLSQRGAQWDAYWVTSRLCGNNQNITCLLAWFESSECEVSSCRSGRPFWKTDSGRSTASEGEGVGRRVQFAPQDTSIRYRSSHGISSYCIVTVCM